ncbi:MAG: hypothetical protein WBQ84_09860, partial [Methylocella sp.]
MPFEPVDEPPCFGGRKSFVERSRFAGIERSAPDAPGGFAGVSLGRLAAFRGARGVDAIARAVMVPTDDVVLHRVARRHVFSDRAPPAAGADSDRGVDPLPHDPRTLVAAMLGRWDRRGTARALLIGQVTG